MQNIPEYDGPLPRDCGTLVGFSLPSGNVRGDDVSFTPWPDDVGVLMPCFSDDPNIACVPIYQSIP